MKWESFRISHNVEDRRGEHEAENKSHSSWHDEMTWYDEVLSNIFGKKGHEKQQSTESSCQADNHSGTARKLPNHPDLIDVIAPLEITGH